MLQYQKDISKLIWHQPQKEFFPKIFYQENLEDIILK